MCAPTSTIANLEADLQTARDRANAWVVGDIDALERQADADKNAPYLYESSWPFVQDEELREIFTEADRRWLDAATAALERNHSTIAVLSVFQLLREDGLLKSLQDKGFNVEAPVL